MDIALKKNTYIKGLKPNFSLQSDTSAPPFRQHESVILDAKQVNPTEINDVSHNLMTVIHVGISSNNTPPHLRHPFLQSHYSV